MTTQPKTTPTVDIPEVLQDMVSLLYAEWQARQGLRAFVAQQGEPPPPPATLDRVVQRQKDLGLR